MKSVFRQCRSLRFLMLILILTGAQSALAAQDAPAPLRWFRTHPEGKVVFSPDGQTLISGGSDGLGAWVINPQER
jgi:hypothetical protein